jgi:L-asparaginase II/alkylhydroperoxidase/carboxymuconolactone decarboxylase family protein YurZ
MPWNRPAAAVIIHRAKGRSAMGQGGAESIVLRRGELVESRHCLDAAVVNPDGALVARVGDPALVTYMRSAAKFLQAIPLVEDGVVDALGLTLKELALACGSHGAEPRHVEVARRMLKRAGFGPEDLACGAHAPMHRPSADALIRQGREAGRIHNNCSGKHAGMLALARHHGWDPVGYEKAGHPVQDRIRREIVRWSGVAGEDMVEGVDGCGVVCFGLPLHAMARAMASLTHAAADGDSGPATVLGAVAAHPFMLAGSDRLCTELVAATRGGVIAKVGAEGVYCATVRESGLGIALKVADGSRRASEAGLLSILRELGALDESAISALALWLPPRVLPNTLGEKAALLEAEVELEWMQDLPETSIPAALSDRQKALVRMSAAIAGDDPSEVRRALMVAKSRVELEAVEECLLQSHLFVGFPRALNGFHAWRETAAPVPAPTAEDRETWASRGRNLCRTVYGDAYEGLRTNIRRLHPDMDRWMVEEGYGKVLGRPGLELPLRELCVVAVLAVQGAGVQLYSHLRGALRTGASPDEVAATLHLALLRSEPGHRRRMIDVWRRVENREREPDHSAASAAE